MKVKKISLDDFSKFGKIGRPLAPEAQTIIEEAKNVPVQSGFVVDGWDLKTRPVSFIRKAWSVGKSAKKFSERRLPTPGSFAILRTK